MRRIRIGILVAACGVVVLAACGDDDDNGGGGEDATHIAATASEFKFEPAAWTVRAGEPFSIEFENVGTVEHEWAVIKLGEDIGSEAEFAEDKVLLEVEAIPAGDSTDEEFTIDEPGSYQVICAIPGHFGGGMEGALTVE